MLHSMYVLTMEYTRATCCTLVILAALALPVTRGQITCDTCASDTEFTLCGTQQVLPCSLFGTGFVCVENAPRNTVCQSPPPACTIQGRFFFQGFQDDCDRYYECDDSLRATTKFCPRGQMFSFVRQDCVNPQLSECINPDAASVSEPPDMDTTLPFSSSSESSSSTGPPPTFPTSPLPDISTTTVQPVNPAPTQAPSVETSSSTGQPPSSPSTLPAISSSPSPSTSPRPADPIPSPPTPTPVPVTVSPGTTLRSSTTVSSNPLPSPSTSPSPVDPVPNPSSPVSTPSATNPTPSPSPIPSPPTIAPPTTTTSLPTTVAPERCTRFGRSPDPASCRRFLVCAWRRGSGFVLVERSCPFRLLYDVRRRTCRFNTECGDRPRL